MTINRRRNLKGGEVKEQGEGYVSGQSSSYTTRHGGRRNVKYAEVRGKKESQSKVY